MSISSRAVRRLALTGWLGLAGLTLPAAPAQAAVPSEKSLPASTLAFVKVNDAAQLRAAFGKSQMGQLVADPALKPLKDDFANKLEDANAKLQARIGVTIRELLELPQGAAWLAILPKDDPKVPVAVVLAADAGSNQKTMEQVMTRATEQAQQAGGKVSQQTFRGMVLHVIRSGKEEDADAPPIVWTNQESVFYIATDVDTLQDVVTQAEARAESLADSESYAKVLSKIGEGSQAHWFLDIAGVFKLITQAGARGENPQQAQQLEGMLQLTGLNGLQAAGGSLSFNDEQYDQLYKTFILSPGQAQGILKVFQLPAADLRPEPWVPATVASYEALSWDLDAAWTAVTELANMFAPGVLDEFQKKLVGPEGGRPLNFQRDIFGPLGDRLVAVSDFKKPITPTSQRMLFAIALEDPKAFQNTLNRVLAMVQANPKKREFQGTTIYDFPMPNLPNAPAGADQGPRTLSVAISKTNLFVSTEPQFLEQALRPAGPGLAENAGFQAVAGQIPAKSSSLSYDRAEEQARVAYDLIKSGQFQKALEGANMVGGANLGKVQDLINPELLPDFSVFAKYLSDAGGYGVTDQDGATFIRFVLRKQNP